MVDLTKQRPDCFRVANRGGHRFFSSLMTWALSGHRTQSALQRSCDVITRVFVASVKWFTLALPAHRLILRRSPRTDQRRSRRISALLKSRRAGVTPFFLFFYSILLFDLRRAAFFRLDRMFPFAVARFFSAAEGSSLRCKNAVANGSGRSADVVGLPGRPIDHPCSNLDTGRRASYGCIHRVLTDDVAVTGA
jgi:hypothetical protein